MSDIIRTIPEQWIIKFKCLKMGDVLGSGHSKGFKTEEEMRKFEENIAFDLIIGTEHREAREVTKTPRNVKPGMSYLDYERRIAILYGEWEIRRMGPE